MSKETLKEYVVTGIKANVNNGLVRLTAEQAASRRHVLAPVEVNEKTGAGIYEVIRSTQFKHGETFDYDGDFPKSMAEEVKPAKAKVKKKPAAEENDPGSEDNQRKGGLFGSKQ